MNGIGRRRIGWAAALAALMGATLWIGWIGYFASDDSLYYLGAERWLTDPPFAGTDHWSTRFPLTLVFAAILRIVGENFAAFGVTAVLFYVVLIVLIGRCAAGIAGERSGWIAAALAATLPVVVSNATSVSVDLIEASALLGGAMLLGDAGDGARGMRRALLAGLCFGIAILCRETSVLPLMGLGVLFVLGRPVPRRTLLICAIGVLLVIGAEAAFQYALTGQPLRRWDLAFHHDSHIDRAANMEGNFLLWWPIDPLLVLLVNDDFGALFWLAGVALAAGTWQRLDSDGRQRLAIVATMALASFVLVGALYTKLVLNPRYFMLPALAAVIVTAAWLDRLHSPLRLALMTAIMGSNLLLLSVGNAHPMWRMEALVDASARYPNATVAGEASDVRRASIDMKFAHRNNIAPLPAAPGGLAIVPAPAAGDVVVRDYPSPPTRLGGVLRALGLEPLVPAPIARRMFAPSPAVVLVRRRG